MCSRGGEPLEERAGEGAERSAVLVRALVRSLVKQGFRRVLLINGHGGNIAALSFAVGELTREFDIPLATITYWRVVEKEFAQILEHQTTVQHACEAETSMVLALVPELVDMSRLSEAKGPTAPELADVVDDSVYRWRSFASRTATGVIGDAALASADKGERLLRAAAEAVAKAVTTPELWSLPR